MLTETSNFIIPQNITQDTLQATRQQSIVQDMLEDTTQHSCPEMSAIADWIKNLELAQHNDPQENRGQPPTQAALSQNNPQHQKIGWLSRIKPARRHLPTGEPINLTANYFTPTVKIHELHQGEQFPPPLPGRLFTVEGPSHRSIRIQRYIDSVVAGHVNNFKTTDTDTVFLLDCYYSHVATHNCNHTHRTLEILSASDDATPVAFAPPQNTLTAKFWGEIARRKQDGYKYVVLSDVMASIRENSPVVNPTHHVKLGVSGATTTVWYEA